MNSLLPKQIYKDQREVLKIKKQLQVAVKVNRNPTKIKDVFQLCANSEALIRLPQEGYRAMRNTLARMKISDKYAKMFRLSNAFPGPIYSVPIDTFSCWQGTLNEHTFILYQSIGKFSSRQIDIFLFSPEYRLRHFIQIVFLGDMDCHSLFFLRK